MAAEILEVLKDICSELAWANILKSYEIKMRVADRNSNTGFDSTHTEARDVANKYLEGVVMDDSEE